MIGNAHVLTANKEREQEMKQIKPTAALFWASLVRKGSNKLFSAALGVHSGRS
jgi:hypothetical protein